MAVKFEIYLCDSDYDRLYAIKDAQGFDNLTGNEFAQKLLENEIHRLHPNKVEDE